MADGIPQFSVASTAIPGTVSRPRADSHRGAGGGATAGSAGVRAADRPHGTRDDRPVQPGTEGALPSHRDPRLPDGDAEPGRPGAALIRDPAGGRKAGMRFKEPQI